MAVPKKRKSKSKTRMRRTINRRESIRGFQSCPHCGEAKLPHRACGACGSYGSVAKKEQVIEVWEY